MREEATSKARVTMLIKKYARMLHSIISYLIYKIKYNNR